MSKHKREFRDLDVCIPVYGAFNTLKENINALSKACGDLKWKFYMVDDKSPEDIETIKKFYAEMRQHPNYGNIDYHKNNTGFPKTVNDCVRLGCADYILILNTDVIMQEKSVEIMLNHLKANDDIGIIAPKLLFFPDSQDMGRPAGKIQHCFMVYDINGKPYHAFNGWDANHPFVNRVKDVNCVTGACMLTRRKLWEKIGGFDLDCGKGTYDDVIYSMEVRLRGMKIRYLPQAVGFHYTGMSVEKYKTGFPLNKNYMLFKSKYGDKVPYDDFLYLGI